MKTDEFTSFSNDDRPVMDSSLLDSVSARVEALYDSKHQDALVQVTVQEPPSATNGSIVDSTTRRQPATVVCVLDVSYSMDSPATMYNDQEGSAGLSMLDVVKHATRSILSVMKQDDRLAVVSYADSAEVVLPLTRMTALNREAAWTAVDNLKTRGSTNLWGGLLQAMELVREDIHDNSKDSNDSSAANILLLTDGLPNIHPPRGEMPTLARYMDRNPDVSSSCRISTFGFGYQLDGHLLKDIAVAGQGYFGFIPDSSFVGTVFINYTANILSTAIPRSMLSLEAADGVVLETLSGQSSCKTDWGLEIDLSSLLYGQKYQVLVKVIKKKGASADEDTVPFVARLKMGKQILVSMACAVPLEDTSNESEILVARARSTLVAFIHKAEVDMKANKSVESVQIELAKAKNTVMALLAQDPSSEALANIAQDLNGQVSEAYSKMLWYNRWGSHYVLSLARAHILQQCSNFKDPGVQSYATTMFTEIRDIGEDIFCQLPPPTPSLARNDGFMTTTTLTSMSAYYNSNAPCFAAGQVRLADGWYAPVDSIRAGDWVATSSSSSNGSARVKCVVVTECDNHVEALVELEGGVLVTPWHPVRLTGRDEGDDNKKWAFPADLAPVKLLPCSRVYSFVLESGASDMIVGQYEAVTLGHGITNDPVAAHAYLGTNSVIEDLSQMQGWKQGRIELEPNPAVRDPETNLITKFRQFRREKEPTFTTSCGCVETRQVSAAMQVANI